ncbi:Nn.00g071470.m01.CDS01 [Neocucurbitaria sp. VM-36]
MDFLRSKRATTHHPIADERPAKRISTPAGQRLSVILDSTRSKSPSATSKINVTTTSTYCNDPTHQHIGPVQHGHKSARKSAMVSVLTGGRLGDTPRESSEDQTPNGSSLSVSVWSDKDAEKFGAIRQQKRRGIAGWGWKKMAIIAAMIVALIIALAVGLAVGLKKKSPSNSTPSTTTSESEPAGSDSSTSTRTNAPNAPTPSSTSTLTPSAAPANFPVGSYSFVMFLDTVTTNCTADPDTWTCAPFTDYYNDPQKALTVLNWEITGSSGSYKISSKGQDGTFGTTFQNENLLLLDKGKDQERYRFQISRSKTVNMTGSIGNERGDFECDFGSTNLQGFLYTKMQRTYPDDTVAVSGVNSNVWPYAVRIEQTVAGGQNVPSCKKSDGEWVTDGLRAQDASTLCSCLYKNWTPAK